MSNKTHQIKFDIPNQKIKYVELPQDPSYIFFEDGRLYSRKSGKWLIKSDNGKGTEIYIIKDLKTNKCSSFSINAAIRKFFHPNVAQIERLQHKTIKNFPNYQLYSDGRVWSRTHNIFLKGAVNNGKFFVALRNDKGEQKTFFPMLALKEYFEQD